ncbi:MFS transporter [Spartinivicinus ruber]|uniref:MFS transporter n=1 Tax=Spartinivicinus ruber TaxID=2683272 RepID=UPI0013D438A6|nr:MFS transporter [Spartinivicinus ruber]
MQLSNKYAAMVVAGNAFEWLDFVVYASLSSILSQVFFPDADIKSGLIMTITIFSISFIARPLGGLIFGHIGDVYGRRIALYASGGLLAIASIGVAIMPTYATIGLAAPLLLLIFRLLQSMAIGGEFPTMVTFLIESSPPGKRGFYGSLAQVTTTTGVILATIIVAFLNTTLTEEQLVAWGWRIPFGFGCITLLMCLYYRFKLVETPEFIAIKARINHTASHQPLKDAFIKHHKLIVKLFMMVMAPAVIFYTYHISSQMLIKHLSVAESVKVWLPIFKSCLLVVLIPVAGYFTDIFGWRRVMGTGLIMAISVAIPVYAIMQTAPLAMLIVIQLIMAITAALIIAPLPLALVDSTEAETRTSVLALGYNLCLVLFGGFTPTINLLLSEYSVVLPGIYIVLVAMISWFAIFKFGQGRVIAQVNTPTNLVKNY